MTDILVRRGCTLMLVSGKTTQALSASELGRLRRARRLLQRERELRERPRTRDLADGLAPKSNVVLHLSGSTVKLGKEGAKKFSVSVTPPALGAPCQ